MSPFPLLLAIKHAGADTPAPPGSPIVWWDVSTEGGFSDGDRLTTLTDLSGNGNDSTTANSNQSATYKSATVTINSLPVALFQASETNNRIATTPPNVGGLDTSAWTAATLAVVGRVNADPAAGSGSAGQFQTVAVGDYTVPIFSTLPWTDGVIYDANFTNATKTTGDPTDSLASPFLYLLTSTANAWTLRINGAEHYTTATNTFKGNSDNTANAILVGISIRSGAQSFLDGVIGEVVVYDSVVSGGDLTDLETYLMTKWGI